MLHVCKNFLFNLHCKYLHLHYISTTTLEMQSTSGSGVRLPDVLHYIYSTSISCDKYIYISLTTEEMQFESFYIYATTEEMYSYYVDINPANGRIFFTVFSATSKMYLNHSPIMQLINELTGKLGLNCQEIQNITSMDINREGKPFPPSQQEGGNGFHPLLIC